MIRNIIIFDIVLALVSYFYGYYLTIEHKGKKTEIRRGEEQSDY